MKEAEKKRHYQLLVMFVNYNKPSASAEEYLNRMGGVMFTKYAKRIQRIIGTTAIKHPLKSLMLLAGQAFIYDVEAINHQAVGQKDFSMLFKDITDIAENVITPAIVKSELYDLRL